MSICSTENRRLEIGLSCPHSHSRPEPAPNHIWSPLKKPLASSSSEKVQCVQDCEMEPWFPKRSLPKGFSRMTWAALHVLLTPSFRSPPAQESTPTRHPQAASLESSAVPKSGRLLLHVPDLFTCYSSHTFGISDLTQRANNYSAQL